MSKTGIIIANTGSPASPTPKAVAAYLRDFLTDPRICPMNPLAWRAILHLFILPKRSAASAEKYRAIWTDQGSPLTVTMDALARAIEQIAPVTAGENAPAVAAVCAMSYGTPTMADALDNLRHQNCDRLVVVPLYPQSAFSTTGVVKDQLARALKGAAWQPPVTVIDSYGEQPAYIAALARSIACAGFGREAGDRLLFAFHSIPLADIEAGDTYDRQTRATAQLVAQSLDLSDDQWAVGYQCRFDKGRQWLGPATTQVLETLAQPGRLFVVAPNFSIDCLETLYDIDMQLRAAWLQGAEKRAERDFIYVPCLNASPDHAHLIRELALAHGPKGRT